MTLSGTLAVFLTTFLLAAGAALAGETGTALRTDDLKAEPFRDARTLGVLTTGEKVEILERQGGWFRVTSGKGRGWVRMLSIRRGEGRKGGDDAAGVFGLATGRAGTGRVVATTGIRGLGEEDLKAARYNEAELRKAESFAATRAQAQGFAAEGRLAPRKVDYLPAPEAAR